MDNLVSRRTQHAWSRTLWIIIHIMLLPMACGIEMKDKPRTVYIKVISLLMEPFVMEVGRGFHRNDSSHGHDDVVLYEGYIVDLLDELASLLGFNYRMTIVKDGRYGFQRSDGTWSGMIGHVMRKEFDIAAAPMLITEMRSEVVDFTEPFLEVQATILFKPQHHLTINSVNDLLHQSEYTIGSREHGIITRAFRKSNDTTNKKIWRQIRRKQPSSVTISNEEGINRARKGGFAFILPSNIGEYIARQEPCDLIAMDRFLLQAHFAMALSKGSGLVTQLNRALFLLEDDGFLHRLYVKWWITKNDCSGIHFSKMYSLNSRADELCAAIHWPVVLVYMCLYIKWIIVS